MEVKELQQHIRTLATLEETSAPVISCYLNLEKGPLAAHNALEARARQVKKSLAEHEWQDFHEAFDRIAAFLKSELWSEAQGVAIFARGGAAPFWLALQFRVPLPNWLAADTVPNIYHLVELKDTYHRYVVMLSTEESARIVEVNLGSITEEIWRARPELRQRVGREWSREHYQNHRRNRTEQFVKEKIAVLEQLMAAGGHTHLVLAGNPRLTAQVRKELPKHLADKLVDTIVASGHDKISDVVAATLSSFIEQEELESQAIAERLRREIATGGLAVIGTAETFAALQRAQVDVLVMARDYAPPTGWRCLTCDGVGFAAPEIGKCTECQSNLIKPLNVREEMIRLAEKRACHVEIVNHSPALLEFGGVGALLRYFSPEQYYWRQQTTAVLLAA